MNKVIVIILLVMVVGGIAIWSTYNRLVNKSEDVDSKWAQVETQYQRRYDLIPNLVSAVKGTMKQEEKIFSDITRARTSYGSAANTDQKATAASQLETGIGRLLAVMENYPTLKSADNVQTLLSQLEGTENRISVERKRFNDSVRDYNVTVKKIPTRWLASVFGYNQREYFELTKGADQVPNVNLQD